MKASHKILFLLILFLGGVLTWEVISFVRTQFLVGFAGITLPDGEIICEGLFLVELAGLFVWLVIFALPTLLLAETLPSLIDSFFRGANSAVSLFLLSIPITICLFFLLKPREPITHHQNLWLTRAILPEKTEQQLIPPRYSELDIDSAVSERGRVSVDAIVLGQLLSLVALAAIFWIRFSDKVLNKEEYARPLSFMEWVAMLKAFYSNEVPEDPDHLEF